MTRDRARAAISRAIGTIHAAYWAACDAEGRAINPADLGAPDGLLDEAQADALTVEYLAQERNLSWMDARDLL